MEDEDPPPPPMLRSPPALPDEIVEEILVRSPPDDPARLVRASLVCKRWARVVSARTFRRRFRDFHLQRGGAPMLGFLHNIHNRVDLREGVSARFVRTSASCPPLDTKRGWRAHDARGGRVLLQRYRDFGHALWEGNDMASAGIRLAVWDPLSDAVGGHLELPVPVLPRRPLSWNAALLCCDQNGLQDDAGEYFRVVLVGTHRGGTFACVYSSLEPAAWSEPIYTAQHLDPGATRGIYADEVRSSALVRNAFYFLLPGRTSILKYDLATDDMCVIQLPPVSPIGTVLMTTEDGDLGFARVEGSKLCLWSMEPRPNGGALAMEWKQGRVIDITSLLPIVDLLGFADGVGMVLVGAIAGFFSVDQNSGRIDKLLDSPGLYSYYSHVVPFVTFYTPALRTASTDEGPSANA